MNIFEWKWKDEATNRMKQMYDWIITQLKDKQTFCYLNITSLFVFSRIIDYIWIINVATNKLCKCQKGKLAYEKSRQIWKLQIFNRKLLDKTY